MTEVTCAQLRYTWAERRLEGTGGGFGFVLRSADWPRELLTEPGIRDLLTGMDDDVRQQPPGASATLVSHLRWRQGALLIAKRPVGHDGAGRPGNYAVHALFDATGTLGSLDLEPLVAGGAFVLERDVEIEPTDVAPSITTWAPPAWRGSGAPLGASAAAAGETGASAVDATPAAVGRAQAREGRGYGDPPLTYRDPAEVADLLRGLCLRLPADLVNQLPVSRAPLAASPGGLARGEVDRLVDLFDEAVALGAADEDRWWARLGGSAEAWLAEFRGFVTMNQPIRRVPDELLWQRWDGATERGRLIVAREIVSRGPGLRNPDGAAEMTARPELLDEVVEVGIQGKPSEAAAAAAWVAAVGADSQVVDFVAELYHLGNGWEPPSPLLDRLQRLPPDALRPIPLAAYVATRLDGSAPLEPAWRAHCLRLRLTGQPTCRHPEDLVGSSSEQDLIDAARAARADGVAAEVCWASLAPLGWPRRAGVLLAAGVDAGFLLGSEVAEPAGPTAADLLGMWSRLAGAAGWSPQVRRLPLDLDRRNRQLLAQRTTLLIALALLAIVAVVLGLT